MNRAEKIKALERADKIRKLQEHDAQQEFQTADEPQRIDAEKEVPAEVRAKAILNSLPQGFTANHADEITALVGATLGMGNDEEWWGRYNNIIEKARTNDKSLAAADPAGTALGGAIGAIGNPINRLGGSSLLGQAAIGAAEGAVAGEGASEHALEDLEPMEIGVPAAIGAGVGALMGAATKAPEALDSVAGGAASRVLGSRTMRNAKRTELKELGPGAVKTGILGNKADALRSKGALADKAEVVKKEAGKEIGKIIDEAEQAYARGMNPDPAIAAVKPLAFVHGKDIAKNIRKVAAKHPGDGNFELRADLERRAQRFESYPPMTLKEVHEHYMSLPYREIPHGATSQQAAEIRAGNEVKDTVEMELKQALGGVPDALPKYYAAKRKYEVGKNSEQILGDQHYADTAHAAPGLIPAMRGGSIGAAAGGPGGAAAGMITDMMVRKRGMQAIASAANQGAKALRLIPKISERLGLGKTMGNLQLGAAHLYLLENDPAYKTEFSDASLKDKATRMKINGLPIPQDALGDRPFSKNPGLGMALLGSDDAAFTVESPEALMQYAQAVQKSDSLNSVQKAGILTQLGKTMKLDVSVEPEAPTEEEAPAVQPQNLQTLKTMLRR